MAPVKNDVLHIQSGRGDLDVLMDVVGLGVDQAGATACARTRKQFRDFCGPQALLASSLVALTGFGHLGLFRSQLEGAVGR